MRKARRIYDFGDLEGDCKSTGKSPKSPRKNKVSNPDPEVSTKKKRRTFSREYKLSILKEIDESTRPGQKRCNLEKRRTLFI